MAGEIQLNSTTMATESSGSITAEVDKIRPNTTNGSLVLQGDSSDAGVTGLTIDSSGNATFAQTISGGTLGSSVVFPAGHILQAKNVTVSGHDTNTTTGAIKGQLTNQLTINSGNYVLIHIMTRFFITQNSNAYGRYHLRRQGETTNLATVQQGSAYTSRNELQLIYLDESPPDITPSYDIYAETASGGTSSVTVETIRAIMYEIKA